MLSYLLNELRNLNEIFMKDVAYDNIKSHKKKQGFSLYLENTFLKSHRGARHVGRGGGGGWLKLIPCLFRVNFNQACWCWANRSIKLKIRMETLTDL